MDPVQRALWFVESHSRGPVTLEDIAKACNISTFHLTRAFASTMGLSLKSIKSILLLRLNASTWLTKAEWVRRSRL